MRAEAGAASTSTSSTTSPARPPLTRLRLLPVACKIAPISVLGGPPVSRLSRGPESRRRRRARRRARRGARRARARAPVRRRRGAAGRAARGACLRGRRRRRRRPGAPARRCAACRRRRGLTVDGVAGPRTRRALGRRGRPRLGSRPLAARARGWDVAALQFLLARHGFPSGPVDGGLGPRTDAALRRFQAWAGLAADGVAGAATLAALRRPPPRSPLRFLRPVAAAVGDGFGPRGSCFHPGLDFPSPRPATRCARGAAGCVDLRGPRPRRLRQARRPPARARDDELVRAPVADRRPARRVRRRRRAHRRGRRRPASPPARTCTSSCACAGPRSTPRA